MTDNGTDNYELDPDIDPADLEQGAAPRDADDCDLAELERLARADAHLEKEDQ